MKSDKIYEKLKRKADSIKTDIVNIKSTNEDLKTYDQFRIKSIIKQNLIEMKNNNILSDKDKYKDFIYDESYDIDNVAVINDTIKDELKVDKNTNCIEELNELELIAINKAKELEKQINFINNKRSQLIIKEFRDKLIEEGESDFTNFNKILNEEYKSAFKSLESEYSGKIDGINNLQNKLAMLQDFIKDLNQELKEEKIALNTAFYKYTDHMEKEKQNAIDKYKIDRNKFIENRVSIFMKHLESKINNNPIN